MLIRVRRNMPAVRLLSPCAALAVALACMAFGCRPSTPTGTYPVQPAGNMPPADTASKTLEYWNGVNSIPGYIAPELKAGPDRQVAALREAVGIIRSNSTAGVDPELADWSARMANLLERRADLIQHSSSPALVAEAFVRGLNGDPLGTAIELNQAQKQWLDDFRAAQRDRHRLKAVLSARYNRQFP